MKKLTYNLVIILFVFLFTKSIFADWTVIETDFKTDNTILFTPNYMYVGTSGEYIYLSSNSGDKWKVLTKGLPSNASISDMDYSKNKLLAAVDAGGIYSSTDNGLTWVASNDGLNSTSINSLVSLNDTLVFACTDDGSIKRSTNYGTTWSNCYGVITSSFNTITANNGILYAGSRAGYIYISTDLGNNWLEIFTTLFSIRSIAVLDNKIFIGTADNGIFVSTDNGATWTSKKIGLSNLNITSLLVNGTKIFAGTDGGGLFFSIDDGETWIAANQGLGDLSVISLAINSGYIYAGTTTKNMWKRLLTDISIPSVDAPVLTTPVDNAIDVDLIPIFQWNYSTGSLSYHIKVAYNEDFSTIVIDKDNLTLNTYKISDSLRQTTKYYWKVAANTPQDSVKWSNVWQFTTLGIVGTPVLLSPANNDLNVDEDPIVTWHSAANAKSYYLQISSDSDLSVPVFYRNNITDTLAQAYGIPSDSVLYWHVGANTSSGNINWSDKVWKFKINSHSTPVTLLTPVDSAKDVDYLPTFTWSSDASAVSYRLQVCKNTNLFSPVADKDNLSATSYTLTDNLLDSTFYSWRVGINKSNGKIKWSNFFNFTTKHKLSVKQEIANSNNIHIYPNPANDNILINYNLKEEVISLRIYDIMSNELYNLSIPAILINNNLRIYTNSYPSGLYRVIVETKSSIYSLPLVIVR